MGQYGLLDRDQCLAQSVVTLHSWEWTTAHDIGIKRHAANWSKGDSENYTAGRKAGRIKPEQQASPRSVIGELAVAKWTNEFWSPMNWHISEHDTFEKLPDVGRNIEVRGIMKPHGTAKVHDWELGQGLILWVAYVIPAEYYQVRMCGWLPYDLAWERGEAVIYGSNGQPSRTDRQVAQPHLFHPLHTAASAAAAEDPTTAPSHDTGCRCRGCLHLLTQVHLPGDFGPITNA